jgi:hypothetical protein
MHCSVLVGSRKLEQEILLSYLASAAEIVLEITLFHKHFPIALENLF